MYAIYAAYIGVVLGVNVGMYGKHYMECLGFLLNPLSAVDDGHPYPPSEAPVWNCFSCVYVLMLFVGASLYGGFSPTEPPKKHSSRANRCSEARDIGSVDRAGMMPVWDPLSYENTRLRIPRAETTF